MESIAKDSRILRIAKERPWILLILMKVLDVGSGSFSATEIAEALSVNSYIVQRALWWLKKYGFVEEITGTTPRRYKLKSIEDPYLNELRQNKWICGNTVVVLLSDNYVVLINRRDNIVARVIPKDIVEQVRNAIAKGKERASEIASETMISPSQAATAKRVLDTIFCSKASS